MLQFIEHVAKLPFKLYVPKQYQLAKLIGVTIEELL